MLTSVEMIPPYLSTLLVTRRARLQDGIELSPGALAAA
jgi:hypothetical protein